MLFRSSRSRVRQSSVDRLQHALGVFLGRPLDPGRSSFDSVDDSQTRPGDREWDADRPLELLFVPLVAVGSEQSVDDGCVRVRECQQPIALGPEGLAGLNEFLILVAVST